MYVSEERWGAEETRRAADFCLARFSFSHFFFLQILEEKEADVEELADKIEALMRELAEKEAEMVADAEEVEALTHDLQKVSHRRVVRGLLIRSLTFVYSLGPRSLRSRRRLTRRTPGFESSRRN
jgi:hypothetical protein